MEFTITINNKKIKVSNNEKILDVLRRIGINIPTLCNVPGLSPTGACRLCVVELNDTNELVPSCSTPVRVGMNISTHSNKVINARRVIVNLLLSNHPDNCLYCDKRSYCELHQIAENLNITDRSFPGEPKKSKSDRSSPGILREMSKCILCGRCVRICEEMLGISAIDIVNRGKNIEIETIFKKGLFYSNCIHCGLCIKYCPTGAIIEKSYVQNLIDKLNNSEKEKVIVISNSTIADISNFYGIKKFTDCRNNIVGALKDIGFDKVFTLSPGNEIFIYENAVKILNHIKDKSNNTLIVTDCPAAKKYVKSELSELSPLLTSIPSPQQILAKFFKKSDDSNVFMTVVTPCVANKYEAVQSSNTTKGVPDIDIVISSNELLRLFNTYGIEFPYSRKQIPDNPSNSDTSAGPLFETKGGISETLIRELLYQNQKSYPKKLFEIKNDKNFIEFSFVLNNQQFKIASIHGISSLKEKVEDILSGKYLFVELRLCENACIDGCVQLRDDDPDKFKKIKKLILDYDETNNSDTASKNPFIKAYKNNNLKQK